MNPYVTLKNAIYYCEDREWWNLIHNYISEAAIYGETAWRMRQILSQNWEYFKQF